MAVIERKVYDGLGFTETVKLKPRVIVVSVAQKLNLQDNDSSHSTHQYMRDDLSFFEDPEASGDWNRDLADVLEFREGAYRIKEGYVYQNLTIQQATTRTYDSADTLVFHETVTPSRSSLMVQSLTLRETWRVGFVRLRPQGDQLPLTGYVSAFVDNPRVVGGGFTTPQVSHTVTLSSRAGTVVLPAPDFNNAETLSEMRVNRKSMGGTYIIFHASGWPTSDQYEVSFSYLNEARVNQLRRVVEGAVGLICTFTDHEGNVLHGIVTTPDVHVVQKGRQNYTASFKFLIAS